MTVLAFDFVTDWCFILLLDCTACMADPVVYTVKERNRKFSYLTFNSNLGLVISLLAYRDNWLSRLLLWYDFNSTSNKSGLITLITQWYYQYAIYYKIITKDFGSMILCPYYIIYFSLWILYQSKSNHILT